jgi:hypothetical protein
MMKATILKERSLKDEEDVKAILRFADVNMDVVRRRAPRDNTLPIFNAILANRNRQVNRHKY